MHSRRKLLAGVLAGAAAPAALASTKADLEGLYLADFLKSEAHELAAGDPRQSAALVGDEAAALAPDPDDKPEPPLNLTDAQVAVALDTIVERARGRRVVILNEAHNVSQCRAFAEALALRLRAVGFDTLAAETFTPAAYLTSLARDPLAVFNSGGPLIRPIGYYSSDPVFAEMLRGARAAGYHFDRYEQKPTQEPLKTVNMRAAIPYREHAEAVNVTQLLRDQPDARVFIYCGYDHAAKRPLSHIRWMAARLMAMTGIDPLSIEQSQGWPPLVIDPHGRVDQVLARFPTTTSIALMRPDGSPMMIEDKFDGAFDVQVVHPRLSTVEGRPGWLATAPGRRRATFKLPAGLPKETLVQAVRADEATAALDAIPSDQYPLAPGAREAVFFLKTGTYVARIETLPASRRALGLFSVA